MTKPKHYQPRSEKLKKRIKILIKNKLLELPNFCFDYDKSFTDGILENIFNADDPLAF